MRDRDRRRLKRYKEAVQFCDSNANLLAKAPPSCVPHLQALRDAVEIIEAEAAHRTSGMPRRTMDQRWAMREILRVKHLAPLRQVMRVAARKEAGLHDVVKVPQRKASVHVLLTVARSAVNDLQAHKATVVRLGFPEDFLEQLQGAIDRVQEAHSSNVAAWQGRRMAVGMIQYAMQEAHDALRCLDVAVRRLCDEEGNAGAGPLNIWNGIVRPVRAGEGSINPYVASDVEGSDATGGDDMDVVEGDVAGG